jgi:two-component system, NarL family, nitrate/nitrite response regulator NarL
MIRVAVVDDHPIARYGFEHLLSQAPGIRVVAVASTPGDVPAGGDGGDAQVDVVVMDLYLDGDRPSLHALRALAALVPVLVMSASVSPSDVVAAIRAGASGYLSKQAGFDAFRAAIETVASGGFWLSSQLADVLRSQLPRGGGGGGVAPFAADLSPREQEVLDCIARGFTHVQTARRMGISKATVDTYVERIRGKMHVGNKAELTRLALERRTDESPR